MTDIGEENQDSILVKAGLFLVILGLNLTLATIPPATNFCETLYELIGHFEFHRHRPGLVDSFSRMGTVIFVPAKRRNSVLSGILCYLAYKACNLNSPFKTVQVLLWYYSINLDMTQVYSRIINHRLKFGRDPETMVACSATVEPILTHFTVVGLSVKRTYNVSQPETIAAADNLCE